MGFNIGANAQVNFSAAQGNTAILNIDSSGTPSEIYGMLQSTNTSGFAPQIFVANANGIFVSATGRIVAPAGVGLLGADLTSTNSTNDFIRANTSGGSYVDLPGGAGDVVIAGAINGSATVNTPAAYITIAGNNVVNTGNLFANVTAVFAGLEPAAVTTDVLLPGGVRRFINTDASSLVANNSAGYQLQSALSKFSIVNTGSISAPNSGGFIALEAAGNIRSGISGSADTQIGLFADTQVITDSFRPDSLIEVYNIVSGYSTNVTMDTFRVNSGITAPNRGDVIINAIPLGTQPSSIQTVDYVTINGHNVTINSTINSSTATPGGSGAINPVHTNAGLRCQWHEQRRDQRGGGLGDDKVLITALGNGAVDATGANSGAVIGDTEQEQPPGGIAISLRLAAPPSADR